MQDNNTVYSVSWDAISECWTLVSYPRGGSRTGDTPLRQGVVTRFKTFEECLGALTDWQAVDAVIMTSHNQAGGRTP